MALNLFTYKNTKTGLAEAKLDLGRFTKALPQFRAKEQLLTGVIKVIEIDIEKLEQSILANYEEISAWCGVFSDNTFDISSFVKIKEVHTHADKVAGIPILKFERVEFYDIDIDYSSTPLWADAGLEIIKDLAILESMIAVKKAKFVPLNKALKKARSKAQLFEKILIPDTASIIRKINQSLQDAETLSICAAKIVKSKKEAEV